MESGDNDLTLTVTDAQGDVFPVVNVPLIATAGAWRGELGEVCELCYLVGLAGQLVRQAALSQAERDNLIEEERVLASALQEAATSSA